MTALLAAMAGFLLFLARIVGVRKIMLAVMLIRPSCDRVFDWIKPEFGQQGPGAAVNGFIIVLAIIAVVHVPEVALSAPLLAWIGFLTSAAASLPYTPDFSAGSRDFLLLVTYAAVFALPYAVIQSSKEVAQCLATALASSLIPSLLALFEIAIEPDIITGEQRLQSTFTHPNIFAFYLVGVVTLILYLRCSAYIDLSKPMRRATLVYAGYLVFLLLLTKTRSAWLAMALIMTGYAVLVNRRWLVLVLCIPVALFIPGVSERLLDLETGTVNVGFERLNSLAWREVLWNDTREWLATNPPNLLGHGLGGYESYVPLFFRAGEEQAAIGLHNAILQIYFEMGVGGIVTFTLLMATIAFKLISMTMRDFAGSSTMLMMCVGYVVVCYSDNLLDYLQFQWFFWFTLGSVCALARLVTSVPRVRLAAL